MKTKITILLTILTLAAAAAFGQTAPVKPAESAKPAEPAKLAASAKLPTAQEIIAKYVKAIGGRESAEKVKSWTSKGTVELAPLGVKGTFETITAAPDRSLTRMNLEGLGEFLDGYDGKVAWSVNPIQGSREKTGIELAQVKFSNNFYRDINMEKIYSKLEVKGVEKVGDKDAYVVVGTPEGLPAATMYFDVNSGLLLRTDSTVISPEGQQPVKVFIDEMKQIEGVLIPSKIRSVLPTVQILLTVTEIKPGPPIDESKFARPKS